MRTTHAARAATVLTILLASAALLRCGVQGTSFLIDDATEAEIGAEVHQQVLAEYPQVTDPTVQAWVDEVGSRIAQASFDERDGVTYQFFVLDADIINAFAAPGGYVYLTSGLILAADNEAEVASVLGHEVGHIAHRHGVAQIERAVALGTLSDVILGDGVAGDVVDFATNFVLGTQYSQAQETDADDIGVIFAYDADFNPFGMVDFFRKLAEAGGSGVPSWLSSHPEPEDRAARAEDNIADLPGDVTRESGDLLWEATGSFDQIQAILAQ
jgi:predicted Zn-dependent protease